MEIEINKDTFELLEEFKDYCFKRWNCGLYSSDTIISVVLERELERLRQTWKE